MPTWYFVDSWYFIAFLDHRDGHHRNISRLQPILARANLATHEGVFNEVLAFFSEEGAISRRAAVRAVRDAIRTIDVITPDRSLFLRALDFYDRRFDKAYSLVDCMSMVIMGDRKIDHVLTNDRHFAQEGFILVSDAP